MSDFEQWMRENYPNFSPPLNEVWDAAIASMQGEALGWVWIIQHEPTEQIVNYGFSFDEPDSTEKQTPGLIFKARKVFTSPSASTEIARLTKELEEARRFIESAFEAHPNLDLDIATLSKIGGGE